MAGLSRFCIAATTFTKQGDLDEDAFRLFLRRFVDAKVGVYLGSGGNGEGHALSLSELERVYEIGVEECKGKIAINANLPEQMTARATLEHARVAVAAGIEVLKIYTLERRHGMRPTGDELIGYYDDILSVIKHPVTIAVNSTIQDPPKPEVLAEICRRHQQITSLAFSHQPEIYVIDLKNLIKRDISYYVQFASGPLDTLSIGADGCYSAEANIIPKTFAKYMDLFESRNFEELRPVATQVKQFRRFTARFGPAGARWIKMCMRALKMPGGELRRPYLMPGEDALKEFTKGLLNLRIPEINELAIKAGLTLPT